MNALNVFFVTRNLHVSAHLYGYLGTAFGAGAVIGALAAGRVVKRLSARVTTWVCLFLSGALIIAYSRQTVFLAGLLLYFAVAVPITMMNTAITPLLLAATPREYMGRVVAFLNPAVQLTAMLSVGIAGWLASSVLRNFSSSLAGWRFGPIDTIFTAAGLLVLLAGGYAVVALPRPAAEPCSAPATQMPGGASGQR
jgi:MFS family permease